MVRWCVNRADAYPAPDMAVRYPAEMNRKNMPAWAWVMSRSVSTMGSKGARMTRPVKFSRKITAISSTAGACCMKPASLEVRGKSIA